MSEKTKLLKSLLLELVVYAMLVTVYFFLVLHFLGAWLLRLFELPSKVEYAAITLSLMVGQGILLELTTSALLRLIRRKTD